MPDSEEEPMTSSSPEPVSRASRESVQPGQIPVQGPSTLSTHEASMNKVPAQDTEPQPPLSSPGQKRSSPTKTSQETTIAELKAQRAALIASLAVLPNVQELIGEADSSLVSSQASGAEPTTDTDIMTAANKIVKAHIRLLHEYNEIKDVGQGLMGLIADARGVRIVEVQDEFGIESKD